MFMTLMFMTLMFMKSAGSLPALPFGPAYHFSVGQQFCQTTVDTQNEDIGIYHNGTMSASVSSSVSAYGWDLTRSPWYRECRTNFISFLASSALAAPAI